MLLAEITLSCIKFPELHHLVTKNLLLITSFFTFSPSKELILKHAKHLVQLCCLYLELRSIWLEITSCGIIRLWILIIHLIQTYQNKCRVWSLQNVQNLKSQIKNICRRVNTKTENKFWTIFLQWEFSSY